MNFPLDHIGIAVTSLNESVEFYQRNYGYAIGPREVIASQGVELAFLELPNTKIELLTPIRDSSSLATFLKKRGPGLHHICYRVTDIIVELARFKGLGFQLIDEKPRPGAYHSQIAFIHPKSTEGVLTELCQLRA